MSIIYRKDKDGQLVIKNEAFKAKTTEVNGVEKSLYKRIHGISFNVTTNGTNTCDFVVPHPHVKIEAIEILNADLGDNCSFKVLDTNTNTYSGLDVGTYGANFVLNQFAFGVYLSTGYYKHESQYDADLYQGMIIRIEFNNTTNNKDIYLNYILNEVK